MKYSTYRKNISDARRVLFGSNSHAGNFFLLDRHIKGKDFKLVYNHDSGNVLAIKNENNVIRLRKTSIYADALSSSQNHRVILSSKINNYNHLVRVNDIRDAESMVKKPTILENVRRNQDRPGKFLLYITKERHLGSLHHTISYALGTLTKREEDKLPKTISCMANISHETKNNISKVYMTIPEEMQEGQLSDIQRKFVDYMMKEISIESLRRHLEEYGLAVVRIMSAGGNSTRVRIDRTAIDLIDQHSDPLSTYIALAGVVQTERTESIFPF